MASEYELDFKAIKGAVSMERLLVDHYKVKLTGKDHEMRGACPLPGCGSTRGLTVNTAKGTGGVWKCHKCGKGGSQLDLVIAMGNAGNTKEAAIYIKLRIIDQGAVAEPEPVSATGGKEPVADAPVDWLLKLVLQSVIEELEGEIAQLTHQMEIKQHRLAELQRVVGL
jgi:hypothetical protein